MNVIDLLEDNNFRILAKSSKLIVGSIYETTYFIDINNAKVLFEHEHYGDPEGAIINADWALSYGDDICICKEGYKVINDNVDNRIVKARFIYNTIVELLTDPWDDDSAIWTLNLEDMKLIKGKEFKVYFNKPYCDDIKW